ncbi:MAG: DUF4143 domain-containing protein [Erysipelotrichaceae bacterium]|nr:DUF4143 domain-containing protein [Erysipelotrichaceae bacterium]
MFRSDTRRKTCKLPEKLGYLYENAAAQIIASSGRKLYYHTWQKPESTHHFEIDFLIHKGRKIIPVEVKSSKVRPHESIDDFIEKYSMHVDRPWLISQLDLNKEGSILFYPIYCLPFLLSEEHMSSAQ